MREPMPPVLASPRLGPRSWWAKSCPAALGLGGVGDPPLHDQGEGSLLFRLPTFVLVDSAKHFVLMCSYTGKEVV